jgi:hypothetical protein
MVPVIDQTDRPEYLESGWIALHDDAEARSRLESGRRVASDLTLRAMPLEGLDQRACDGMPGHVQLAVNTSTPGQMQGSSTPERTGQERQGGRDGQLPVRELVTHLLAEAQRRTVAGRRAKPTSARASRPGS